jgi:predicted site-specific integrase-resolvase
MAVKELMPLLTAKEAAEFLHVSMFTLSKIEREGDLVPFRTPGGHRRYSMDMLRRYLESTRDHPLNQRISHIGREMV